MIQISKKNLEYLIVKRPQGYYLITQNGCKICGPYNTFEQAEERHEQIKVELDTPKKNIKNYVILTVAFIASILVILKLSDII